MTADGWKTTKYRTESTHRRDGERCPDREIARLAAAQHGVVALDQLKGLGLAPSTIRSRVGAGRLHRLHRSVYAVGHPLVAIEGRWMAAVLACGEGSLLSHRSAAALWGLLREDGARTDVTSPGRRGRQARLAIHCGDTLAGDDRAHHRAIPLTSVSRTLLDLAAVVRAGLLQSACREAEVLRIFDLRAIEEVLERSRGRRGVRRLRAVIADLREPDLTRSELEERFLALCRRAALPWPRVNSTVAVGDQRFEVDFAWPESRLIVELDGRRFHDNAFAFERDRRRDRRLALGGWRVIRATWLQVVREEVELGATVRTLLSA